MGQIIALDRACMPLTPLFAVNRCTLDCKFGLRN